MKPIHLSILVLWIGLLSGCAQNGLEEEPDPSLRLSAQGDPATIAAVMLKPIAVG